MNHPLFVPFKKTHNYFVHRDGYVFMVSNGRDFKVKSSKHKNGKLYVEVNKVNYILLNIMLEHFVIDIKQTDNFKYKATKDGFIPAKNISIRPFIRVGLTESQETLLNKYKCDIKSAAANYRCTFQVTPIQVYTCLEIHNFTCVYCGEDINPLNWHLDHYTPLSKGGKNKFENIVPSCSTCNLMKGAMHGYQFYKKCIKIVDNYKFKEQF